jgi:acetyltransferase-like isoleucine patch superfamily enzyme
VKDSDAVSIASVKLPMLSVRPIVQQILWALKSLRYISQVHRNGRVVLRIDGAIEGKLHLGVHYGIWTSAPTFLYIGERGVVKVNGHAYFYGDNTIRVETGATLKIGDGTHINIQSSLNVKQAVAIGENCMISQGVHIRDNDGHKLNGVEGIAPVYIDNHVWIGYGAMILKGVHINTGAIVAAEAVVTSNVPAHAVVGGNPAKVLRSNIEWSA